MTSIFLLVYEFGGFGPASLLAARAVLSGTALMPSIEGDTVFLLNGSIPVGKLDSEGSDGYINKRNHNPLIMFIVTGHTGDNLVVVPAMPKLSKHTYDKLRGVSE